MTWFPVRQGGRFCKKGGTDAIAGRRLYLLGSKSLRLLQFFCVVGRHRRQLVGLQFTTVLRRSGQIL
jgi:hypothetical protein